MKILLGFSITKMMENLPPPSFLPLINHLKQEITLVYQCLDAKICGFLWFVRSLCV